MSDRVLIIGAGGHAKVVADVVMHSEAEVIGFLDDDPHKTAVLGRPVLGTVEKWKQYATEASFLFGIGSNTVRRMWAEKICGTWYTGVHPTARKTIGRDVSIGRGSVIMANAVVNAGTHIGEHCIINTAAVVEHDNLIEDFVHISPHATLCGTVLIGEGTHIGAGAVIRNNVSICPGCIIGAGSVVVKNITEPGTYVGVPARRIK